MSRDHRLAPWPACISVLLLLLAAASANAEYLGNISFSQPSPSRLPNGLHIDVSIDYKIDDPAGRRIYVIPYTDGAPSPGYGVSGSVVHPAGAGTATAFLTITGGEVIVDEVRVYSRDPDFTETPLEIFVPVHFEYGPHGVYNIDVNHSRYSRLRHGMDLEMTFDYATSEAGCRIFARPFSSGQLTPGYSASGSADLPPSGTASQHFSFDADADITHIRFQMVALDNTTVLREFFVPWPAAWRQWGVYDLSFNHDTLSSLHHDQNLVTSMTVDHEDPDGLRVWTWGVAGGSYAPNVAYQGSILEPAGAHDITRYFHVTGGTTVVEAVRVTVGQSDQVYDTFDIPLRVQYGPHALPAFDFTPGSPAILSYGEPLEMTFDYVTDQADGVRIYGRAAFQEEPLMGMTSAGSPLYPAPSGSGDFWMYYGADRTADSIRFQMVTGDQSELLLEWFEPGWFIWSGSGVVTGADTPPVAVVMGRCYPNPFNPAATIPVAVGHDTRVRIALYDVRGRLARVVHDGLLPAGDHALVIDGTGLGSGAYVCRLETPTGVQTQRLTLVK
jgi:hypothetical protein